MISDYVGFLDDDIPFSENWDNYHCHECCVKMVLDYFEPHNDLTFSDLDLIAGKARNAGTWPQRTMLKMAEKGYCVQQFATYSMVDMLMDGLEKFMIKTRGQEYAKTSYDLREIEGYCQGLVENPLFVDHQRPPSIHNLRYLLGNNNLVISSINSRVLSGKSGFSGHFVLIYGVDDTDVYIHDPGGIKTGKANKKVSIDTFLKCVHSPSVSAWGMAGYKPAPRLK